MNEKAGIKAGIASHRGGPGEVIRLMVKSSLVKETLGECIFDKFIEDKKLKWDSFRTHVGKFEIDRYLPML